MSLRGTHFTLNRYSCTPSAAPTLHMLLAGNFHSSLHDGELITTEMPTRANYACKQDVRLSLVSKESRTLHLQPLTDMLSYVYTSARQNFFRLNAPVMIIDNPVLFPG